MQVVSDHIALTKPRVISLLLWTAFGGMVIADRGIPALTIVGAVLIGGALASGGASSINQALEAELDVAMRRTSNRPVASGRIGIRHAMVYGLLLNVAAFALIVVAGPTLSADPRATQWNPRILSGAQSHRVVG